MTDEGTPLTQAALIAAYEAVMAAMEPDGVYAIVDGRLWRGRRARIEEGVTSMPWLDYLSAEDIAAWEAIPADSTPSSPRLDWPMPIAERPATFRRGLDDDKDLSPGRRMRVFSQMVGSPFFSKAGDVYLLSEDGTGVELLYTEPLTYAAALADCEANPTYHQMFTNLPLRIGQGPMRYSIDPNYRSTSDPALPVALYDLSSEILEDVREACFALDDPGLYYPGVDEGIEPVTDDHIALVIWALQRELNRELRAPMGSYSSRLPAVPLASLPWNVQRALAERRRLRYQEFGIGKEEWEQNSWSLWDVPIDPEFIPRRKLRKAGQA